MNTNERYTYEIKPHRKNLGVIIAALMLACTLFGAAGGTLGAYFLMNTAPLPVGDGVLDVPSGGGFDSSSPAADLNLNDGEQRRAEGVAPYIEQLTVSQKTKLSLQEIYANSNPAVVAVATEYTGRNAFGQIVSLPAAGSGFIISNDGYIVTNNHVIENASTVKVQLYDGKSYDAKVIGVDNYTDLAVLKIDAKGLKYLTFSDSDILVGDQVAAIGNPLGQLANTFTVGYISALHREINIDGIPRTMLQTDAAVNNGNSGGPLLNEYGYVIGVVAAKSSGLSVEGLGFAIPSDIARKIVEQIIENGYVKGRPYLGISAQTRMSGFNQMALQVTSVEQGGGADKAGVQEGDYILEVGGETVNSRESLLGVLYKLKAGDTVKVKIQRDGQTLTVDVTLGEMKPS